MSPSATPATQSGAAPRASQATNPGPRAPPSPMSATPTTQNDGRCEFVPRLPRKTTVDVSLCRACHAHCRGVIRDQTGPSAPPSPMSATPATQNDGRCELVPRLPRKNDGRYECCLCTGKYCVKVLYVKFVCVCVKFLYVSVYGKVLCEGIVC